MDHKNYNNVTKPKHYQFSNPCNEVRDVIRDRLNKLLEFSGGQSELLYDYSNAIKYLLRWFEKNGTEDLRKAQYCIDSMLRILEDGKDSTDKFTERKSGDDVPLVDLNTINNEIDKTSNKLDGIFDAIIAEMERNKLNRKIDWPRLPNEDLYKPCQLR
jgi:hypothetical protein